MSTPFRRALVALACAALLASTGATAGTPSDPPSDPPVTALPAEELIGPSDVPTDERASSDVLAAMLLLESLPQGQEAAPMPPQAEIDKAQALVEAAERRSLAAVRRSPCYVPFPQTLRYGMRGKDVTALQLALKKAGFAPSSIAGYFGSSTRTKLKRFQRSVGIASTGVYGRKTHLELDCHFGPKAKRLMYEKRRILVETKQRERIRSIALYAYQERAEIHYSQGIYRMRDFLGPPNVPNQTDCSGFTTWVYKSAGAKDPNCRGYDGFGFTGTQLNCGRRIFLNEVDVGDLVFYSGHVAVYIGRGRVVSHGSEQGPIVLPVTYRTIYQVRTYL